MTGVGEGNAAGAPAEARPSEGILAVRRALLRSAVSIALVAVVLGSLLAVAGGLLVGADAAAGAVLGTVLASGFVLVTVVVGWATAGRDPVVMAAALLGSWLVKAVVVLVVLLLAERSDAVDQLWTGIAMVVGIVASLTVQTRLLLRARVPYVDAPSRREDT